jgi:hypothetical protein
VNGGRDEEIRFWMAQGFQKLISSHTVVIDPRIAAVRAWAARVSAPPGLTLRPLDDPPSVTQLAAVAAFYQRIHRWDPSTPLSTAQVKGLLCNDLAFGFVGLAAESIVAIALCRHGSNGFEAALIGAIEREDDAVAKWMLASLCTRVEAAIEMEVDEGVGANLDLLRVLSEVPDASWGPTVLVLSDRPQLAIR